MNSTFFDRAALEGDFDVSQLAWSYEDSFARNRGLVSPREQEKLRATRVAIAGMGGVGGVHLVTLARLGIGKFRIADDDTFETANFNRQYGANVRTVGQPKVHVMAQSVLEINPSIELEVVPRRITVENAADFVKDCDVVLDGIDFFSFQERRELFRQARLTGAWGVTAGPIGFSTAWLTFDPRGMSFDEYFDMHDDMDPVDQFAAFAIGLAPRATHWGYFDLSQVNQSASRGPSLGLACHLASGVAAAEIAKILLGRGPLRPVPYYAQFDAYRCLLRRGRILWGNRHPWQRFKRRILASRFRTMQIIPPNRTQG